MKAMSESVERERELIKLSGRGVINEFQRMNMTCYKTM